MHFDPSRRRFRISCHCALDMREIGGILTLAYWLSYHVFSNMRENRMNIGDFHDLACFNCLSYFSHLGPISRVSRHQRHQDSPLQLPDLICCFDVDVRRQPARCGHFPRNTVAPVVVPNRRPIPGNLGTLRKLLNLL